MAVDKLSESDLNLLNAIHTIQSEYYSEYILNTIRVERLSRVYQFNGVDSTVSVWHSPWHEASLHQKWLNRRWSTSDNDFTLFSLKFLKTLLDFGKRTLFLIAYLTFATSLEFGNSKEDFEWQRIDFPDFAFWLLIRNLFS